MPNLKKPSRHAHAGRAPGLQSGSRESRPQEFRAQDVYQAALLGSATVEGGAGRTGGGPVGRDAGSAAAPTRALQLEQPLSGRDLGKDGQAFVALHVGLPGPAGRRLWLSHPQGADS